MPRNKYLVAINNYFQTCNYTTNKVLMRYSLYINIKIYKLWQSLSSKRCQISTIQAKTNLLSHGRKAQHRHHERCPLKHKKSAPPCSEILIPQILFKGILVLFFMCKGIAVKFAF